MYVRMRLRSLYVCAQMRIHISVSACLSIYLSIYLLVCLSTYLPIYLPIYLSTQATSTYKFCTVMRRQGDSACMDSCQAKAKEWAPLIMKGRDPAEPICMTKAVALQGPEE